MPFVRQRYGKANVRVLRVQRAEDRHQVRESRVTIILDGEFSRAYTDADNASVVATDTMKNLVNVLALQAPGRGQRVVRPDHRAVLPGPLPAGVGSARPGRRNGLGPHADRRPRARARLRESGGRNAVRLRDRDPVFTGGRSRLPRLRDHEDHGLGVRRLSAGRVHDVAADHRPHPGHPNGGRLAVRGRRAARTGRLRRGGRRDSGRSAAGLRHDLQPLGAGQPVPDGRGRARRRARRPRDHPADAQRPLSADRPLPVRAGRARRVFLPTDEPSGQIEATLRRG